MVIGNPSPNANLAFADAYYAAEALEQVESAQVYMFRDLNAEETEAVLDTSLGQRNVIIYFSGEVTGSPNQPLLKGAGHGPDGVDLQAFLDRLAENGTQRLALLVETCAGDSVTGQMTLTPPSGIEVLLATSDAACDGDRMTTALTRGDARESLQNRLSETRILASSAPEISLVAPQAAPSSGMTTSSAEVARVTQDVVSILPAAVSPIGGMAVVTPAAFGQDSNPSQFRSNAPQTVPLPAAVTSGIAAAQQQDGLPEPSIIVGIINPNGDFEQIDPDQPDVSSSEIAYDELAARQDLRSSSPELFAGLVDSGAFDPPSGQVEWAIQTELARMNCYRSGIDGIWGNGSRGSVDRYFVEIGESAPTREPEASLFRIIISRDDVACPTHVVVAAPRPVASSAPSSSPSRPAAAAPSAPARAPQPAAPASGGGGLGDVNLGGVFR